MANPWCHGCRSLIIRHARQCGSCGCVWHPCWLMMLLESHSELFPKISQSQIGMDTWGWTHIDMEKPRSPQEMIFWQSNMAMEHSLSWMIFKVKSVFHNSYHIFSTGAGWLVHPQWPKPPSTSPHVMVPWKLSKVITVNLSSLQIVDIAEEATHRCAGHQLKKWLVTSSCLLLKITMDCLVTVNGCKWYLL